MILLMLLSKAVIWTLGYGLFQLYVDNVSGQ